MSVAHARAHGFDFLLASAARQLLDVQSNYIRGDVDATVDCVVGINRENSLESVQQGRRVHGCARHDGLARA